MSLFKLLTAALVFTSVSSHAAPDAQEDLFGVSTVRPTIEIEIPIKITLPDLPWLNHPVYVDEQPEVVTLGTVNFTKWESSDKFRVPKSEKCCYNEIMLEADTQIWVDKIWVKFGNGRFEDFAVGQWLYPHQRGLPIQLDKRNGRYVTEIYASGSSGNRYNAQLTITARKVPLSVLTYGSTYLSNEGDADYLSKNRCSVKELRVSFPEGGGYIQKIRVYFSGDQFQDLHVGGWYDARESTGFMRWDDNPIHCISGVHVIGYGKRRDWKETKVQIDMLGYFAD